MSAWFEIIFGIFVIVLFGVLSVFLCISLWPAGMCMIGFMVIITPVALMPLAWGFIRLDNVNRKSRGEKEEWPTFSETD